MWPPMNWNVLTSNGSFFDGWCNSFWFLNKTVLVYLMFLSPFHRCTNILNSIELISSYRICKWSINEIYARIRTTPSDLLGGYDFCILTSTHFFTSIAATMPPNSNSGDNTAATTNVIDASVAGKTNDFDFNKIGYIKRMNRRPAPISTLYGIH